MNSIYNDKTSLYLLCYIVDSPSIRHRNSTWKVRQNYIDFERQIHVEIMTSIRRGFDFQNRRNIDEFSTWIFLCRFDVKST